VRVIVVGGGAVGLCVAEALTTRGAEVTVFERDRCGAGASAGNAGWITPSLAIPVPGPGVIGQSLRWLVNPSGPLWIRPTLSPAMLAWTARFVASCRGSAYRLAERGVEFELHNAPLLYPAFEQAELEHLRGVADELIGVGAAPLLEEISAAELRTVEPALSERVLGGLIARVDRRVRPESFCDGLRRAVVAGGAEVLEHSGVAALGREGTGWMVSGGGTRRYGDAIVLAGGVASAGLLSRLGVRLPIVAAKGYSRTYPSDETGPHQAMYLETPKVAISAYDGVVRVSGTLELGARGLGLSEGRLRAITAAAQQALPGWRMPSSPRDWAGMRSLSPDGLPFIGPVPGLQGLHVAAGHATLGITLAPLTGELVADLVLEGRRSGALTPFDPSRAIGGYFKPPRVMRPRATTGGPR
jgi:D-amino-acid dehydrogenase